MRSDFLLLLRLEMATVSVRVQVLGDGGLAEVEPDFRVESGCLGGLLLRLMQRRWQRATWKCKDPQLQSKGVLLRSC